MWIFLVERSAFLLQGPEGEKLGFIIDMGKVVMAHGHEYLYF